MLLQFIGWTPLHFAAQQGYSEVCKVLLENQAEKNPKNNKGWTPLHCAAQKGKLNVCKTLIEAGLEVNSINNKGETPLKLTIHPEVATFLRSIRKRKIISQDSPYSVVKSNMTLNISNTNEIPIFYCQNK